MQHEHHNQDEHAHGMPIASVHASDKHEGHHTQDFLEKFWVALVLTIPIFLYSEMAAMLFGLHLPKFTGLPYVLLLLGSIVFVYCGLVFLVSAYREIVSRNLGMMTLVALAITAAYSYSFFSVLLGGSHDLWFELSSLIAIMLLGHWIEMRSVQGTQGALSELAKLLPDTAEVIRGDATVIIPLGELRVGDVVLVKPGSKIPADGKIIEGSSEVDESVVSGESRPVEKVSGEMVIAGTRNGDGALRVVMEKIGEETFLAGVMRLVALAQSSKSRLQILSDRAAFYLTIIAITTGTTTFAVWILVGAGLITATERFVAVLVIACPHALGLAVPLVASISTAMAARNGLLITDRRALEVARDVTVVLFDKTGTLTKGEFGVDAIIPNGSESPERVLQFAASINKNSEHPLAKAMVAEAEKRGIALSPVEGFVRLPGLGSTGQILGVEVFVGSGQLLVDRGSALSDTAKAQADAASREGKTVVHIIAGGALLGSIALADVIREESREAIRTLKSLGIRSAMITGDSEDVAAWVARELGIDEYFAKVMPGEKAEKVKLLQGKGQKVAMVGDGVNDAPALMQADLGIAVGAGTNVAIESAGIILVKSDPRDIPKIITLSRLTYAKMIQNLFWATGYNVVAIPLAAGVLAPWGVILEPAIAAVLMSASTVIVAFNAVLLRRKKV